MIQLRGLSPALRPTAEYTVDLARQYGLEVFITSVYRSWREQAQLRRRYERCVAQGRFPEPGTECAYPANLPGDSAHNWGLAFDSTATFSDREAERWWGSYGVTDPLEAWAMVRSSVGWEVYAHDLPHSQLPNWRRYAPADRLTDQAGYTGT